MYDLCFLTKYTHYIHTIHTIHTKYTLYIHNPPYTLNHYIYNHTITHFQSHTYTHSFQSYYQYLMMMAIDECRCAVNSSNSNSNIGCISIDNIVYTEPQAQYLPMYIIPLLSGVGTGTSSTSSNSKGSSSGNGNSSGIGLGLATKRCKLCTLLVSITQSGMTGISGVSDTNSTTNTYTNTNTNTPTPISAWNQSNAFITLQSGDLVILSRSDWAGVGVHTTRSGSIIGVVLGWDPDFYEYVSKYCV